MEWTVVSKKRRVRQPVKEPKLVSMDSRGKDPCWKFVVELGDYRTEPEILAELRLRYPWVKLGRRNGVSSNAHLTAKVERSRSLLERTSIPQWEYMCISSPGIRNQEDLHSDGGPNTHHGKAPSTRRASTGCRTHDALGLGRQTGCSHRHGEGCALREATPGKVQQGLRELPNATVRQGPTAVLQLPEVWPHGQDMPERKPDNAKGTARSPSSVPIAARDTQPPARPVPKANLGKQIQGNTKESRTATDTGSPNQECLDQKVCANNGRLPTNFNYSRGPSHTETYSRSIKATSSTTETRSYQGSYHISRSATADTQGTTPSTREERQSAMWSRPKKSTVEPTGGVNRSNNYCSGRGNNTVEESFNREKAPYLGTTEDDRGSSGCDQYPLRIDIEGCFIKGPFHDHGCSHPVGYGNGPFQDHRCSHPVCFDNGPFQDHGCSHPVCSNNGPFQDHGCVHHHPACSDNGPSQDNGGVLPVCSSNGPFQNHGGVHPVCSDNGPFQDNGCVRPVCSDNGPFQDNGCSHPVCTDNGPLQDHGCSHPVCSGNCPFQDHRYSRPVCSDNDPLQDHGCVHPVCSDNGPFQDHDCSHPVCSGNGPFQDHRCSRPVCSDNGLFQDHGCVHPVCSDNSPFQDHGRSQPVCSDNGPSQDNGGVLPVCSNGPFQDHGGVLPVCSGNGPFQDNGGSQPVCPDNGPFHGNHVKPVTNTVISPTGRANYIKLVHWNAQGAISKTSAIKTVIVQDDIDIVMIQDTIADWMISPI